MVKILLVVLLAGCASVPGWEPVMARRTREAVAVCRDEARVPHARLVWMSPDGSVYRVEPQFGDDGERFRACLSSALGTRWVR